MQLVRMYACLYGHTLVGKSSFVALNLRTDAEIEERLAATLRACASLVVLLLLIVLNFHGLLFFLTNTLSDS